MGGLLGGQLPSVQHWSGTENSPTRTPKKAGKNDQRRDSKKFCPGNYEGSFPCVDLCTCLCVDEGQLLCITE